MLNLPRFPGMHRTSLFTTMALAITITAILTTVFTVYAQTDDPDWKQALTGLTASPGNSAGEMDITWDESAQTTKPLNNYRVTWTPDGQDFKGADQTGWSEYTTDNEWTVPAWTPGQPTRSGSGQGTRTVPGPAGATA